MTITEAKRILEAPRFGDAECIKAVAILEAEGQRISMAEAMSDKVGRCIDCGGGGNQDCNLGHSHSCKECGGSGQREIEGWEFEGMDIKELVKRYGEFK